MGKPFKTYLGDARCECGGTLKPSFVKEYDVSVELGIPAKLFGHVSGLLCTHCKTFMVSIAAIEAGSEAAVDAVLALDRCLTGKEAAFLRKAVLGVSQGVLAEKLGVSRPTVARWETATSLSPNQDFDLRGIVLGHVMKSATLDASKKGKRDILTLARTVLDEARQKRAPKRVKPLQIAA